MKRTIMHPDYWVEIPAGEFIIGMSDEQREGIWEKLLEMAGYYQRPLDEQIRMEEVIERCRRQQWPYEEKVKVFAEKYQRAVGAAGLINAPPQQTKYLKRFYIARFPLTRAQGEAYRFGTPAHQVSGALEAPLSKPIEGTNFTSFPRECEQGGFNLIDLAYTLGARFPTEDEWEKAARGTDGRLYPWGNEWNLDCGFFYYRQKHDWASFGYDAEIGYSRYAVDAYPMGQSPYGVWAMMGGIPETLHEKSRRAYCGRHPRHSSEGSAFIDFLVGTRSAVKDSAQTCLRMVMDEWPRQQWTGADVQEGD